MRKSSVFWAVPHRELARLAAPPLKLAKRAIDAGKHQHALVDLDEPSRDAVDESERPLEPHGKPRVVPVPEWRRRGQYGRDLDLSKALILGDRAPDDLAFECELVSVVYVLPLAACTRPEEGTRRSHPVRRGFEHLRDQAGHPLATAAPVADDSGDHLLARYAAEDVDRLAVQVRNSVSQLAKLLESKRRRFC